MKGYVEVKLHGTDPEAVETARKQIEELPDGALLVKDGRYFVPDGFVAWAVVHEGYVQAVVWPEPAEVSAFVCGKHWCGREGQEHEWTGPVVQIGEHGMSVTCARCGLDAMSYDMMRMS